MPTYQQLSEPKHPEYDAKYWRKIRTLYEGQASLRKAFKDPVLQDELFPRHLGEEENVYQERVKRAWITPYVGYLFNWMLAALGADPVRVSEDPGDEVPDDEEVVLSGKTNDDPYYDSFFTDCSPPGGQRMSVNQLLREQILNAFISRRAWTLLDFPRKDVDMVINTRADEEAAGLDKAYACPLDPECVYDWETDEYGNLAWALTCSVTNRRKDLGASRKVRCEEYTFWTPEGWERYIYEYDPNKNPPKPDQAPDQTLSGTHPFGKVPLVRLELPDGLWAGAKIEGMATAHFNKRAALDWGMYRSLFQFIVVTLQEPNPLNPISEDTNRAISQPIGPGRVLQLAEKDRADMLGPNAEPFKVAMADLDNLRDEMHRVLHQMANSVNNSGAALGRSAQSKQVDQQAAAVILKEIGRHQREHAQYIFEMVSAARSEEKTWVAQGADQFDEVAMDSLVAEAAMLETVPIPSPTFQALYKFELARRALPGATDQQLGKIQEELVDNITAESEMQKTAQDVTSDRLDDGVLPGEQPPQEDGAPPKGPPKAKSKDKAKK